MAVGEDACSGCSLSGTQQKHGATTFQSRYDLPFCYLTIYKFVVIFVLFLCTDIEAEYERILLKKPLWGAAATPTGV